MNTTVAPLQCVTRWKLLAEASAAFDSSLDYAATLSNVARLIVPTIADFCTVMVLDEHGRPVYAAGAAHDPAKESLLRRMADYAHSGTLPNHPVSRTLATQQPGIFATDSASLRQFAVDDEHYAILRKLDPKAILIVPLAYRDEALGVLVFGMGGESGRSIVQQDAALGGEIGRRASLAIAHARMYDAAQRAIQTRDQLVATLSHDLKNPIATVRMSVDFALELLPDDSANARVRRTLAAGRRASDRMLRLVHDLLDVAAIEAGRLRIAAAPEKVTTLVVEAIDAYQLEARAQGVELLSNVAPSLPRISVDHERILQVFSNLIGNALKFTKAGGHVVVTAEPDDQRVRFVVADTGCGIAAEDLSHVFDRFWRADGASQPGTGLGLAIAQGIVAAHGGVLEVKSTVGVGSEFSFTVPVAKPEEVPREAPNAAEPSAGRSYESRVASALAAS